MAGTTARRHYLYLSLDIRHTVAIDRDHVTPVIRICFEYVNCSLSEGVSAIEPKLSVIGRREHGRILTKGYQACKPKSNIGKLLNLDPTRKSAINRICQRSSYC
jgi:hypothetical protein